jgi:hypothetical protein
MSTFAIVVLVIAIGAVATFIAMKKGTIADANNNNIPDAIEEKIEEAKVVVKKAKAKVEKVKNVVTEVKEVAKKVKAVAEKVTKVAKTVVVEKKATKKPAAKKTK